MLWTEDIVLPPPSPARGVRRLDPYRGEGSSRRLSTIDNNASPSGQSNVPRSMLGKKRIARCGMAGIASPLFHSIISSFPCLLPRYNGGWFSVPTVFDLAEAGISFGGRWAPNVCRYAQPRWNSNQYA